MMPLNCFLLAIYPVLFLWSRNWEEVFFTEISVLIAVVLGSTIVLHQVFRLIFPTTQKATLATLLSLIMLISFDHFFTFDSAVFQFLHKKELFGITIGRYAVLLPAWMILYLCLMYFVYKTKRDLSVLPQFFTTMSLILVLTTIPSLFSSIFFKALHGSVNSPEPINITMPHAKGTSSVGYIPNIYYIVLDAYARNDILKNMYGLDNSNFTKELEKHGFFIADKSCSNYAMTYLSLPSFFTSTYHKDSTHYSPSNYLNKSSIIKFFKQHGYTFINLSHGCGFTKRIELANKEPLRSLWSGPLAKLFIYKTFFGPFLAWYHMSKYGQCPYGEALIKQLNAIEKLPLVEKNPFVAFCHILCPHSPFVLKESGEVRDTNPLLPDDYFSPNPDARQRRKKAYVEQVKGLNKHIAKMIESILTTEKNKPIIIIHADHGSRHIHPYHCAATKGTTPNVTLKERMSILSAFYFPHGGNEKLYPEITPVNNLRMLCNHYFDTDLEIFPDTCYWSVDESQFSWTEYSPEHINSLPFDEAVS